MKVEPDLEYDSFNTPNPQQGELYFNILDNIVEVVIPSSFNASGKISKRTFRISKSQFEQILKLIG